MDKEAIVAKVSDLNDGDMKEVVVGETKVLLAKINGFFMPLRVSAPIMAARWRRAP